MTILCRTEDHLAEFEAGYLTISRYSDGHCKAWKLSGIASLFRADLKRVGPERAIEVYLRLMRRAPWEPLYKPGRMPGVDPSWDADCGHVFEFSEITTRRRSEARFATQADSFRTTGGFA